MDNVFYARLYLLPISSLFVLARFLKILTGETARGELRSQLTGVKPGLFFDRIFEAIYIKVQITRPRHIKKKTKLFSKQTDFYSA